VEAEEQKVERWEYHVESFYGPSAVNEYRLNPFGVDRWELVQLIGIPYGYPQIIAVFKRRLLELN
jgi:hypothetical protein